MTQENINVGTIPNDGTGDVLRISFEKTNNNFTELYTTTGDIQANLDIFFDSYNTFQGDILDETGLAFDTANAAFDWANGIYWAAERAFGIANSANQAWLHSNSAYLAANAASDRLNVAFDTVNSSFYSVNTLGTFANNLNTFAIGVAANAASGYDHSNLAFQLSGEAFDGANAAIDLTVGAIANLESAYRFANGVSVNATAAYRVTNSAYTTGNSNYGVTNACFYKTNSAYATVNAAYTTANAKINTVNGIATGIFNVQGTHRVDGQVSVYGNTNRFEIIDGLIYINGIKWDPTPVAAIIYSGSQIVPSGYLAADGQAVSRITYSALFEAIGTTFGTGNGTTTFNVPDLRGQFIRGWDGTKGIDSGRVFGSTQLDLFGSHNHASSVSLSDPGHEHTVKHSNALWGVSGGGFVGGSAPYQDGTNMTGVSGTGISVSVSIGSSGGTETRPKNVALFPLIKY
jgi:microcystin-dependent protein